jgi:hypothetical protein
MSFSSEITHLVLERSLQSPLAMVMERVSVHVLELITSEAISQQIWITTMSSILWKWVRAAAIGKKESTQNVRVSHRRNGAEKIGALWILATVNWMSYQSEHDSE